MLNLICLNSAHLNRLQPLTLKYVNSMNDFFQRRIFNDFYNLSFDIVHYFHISYVTATVNISVVF